MPVNFVFIRAGDVPRLVLNEKSKAKAGITGSDIVWESGLGKQAGEEIPIYELNPGAKKSALYIGVANNFFQYIQKGKGRKPKAEDLANQTIVTKYPNITRDVVSEKQIKDVEIFTIPGTDEAVQYLFPDYNAILGIINTGETRTANGIEILEIFYKVTIRLLEASDKMSRRDKEILDNLRERIVVAVQRKRMI